MEYVITTELVNRFNAKWKVADSGCFEWTAQRPERAMGRSRFQAPGARNMPIALPTESITETSFGQRGLSSLRQPGLRQPAHLWLGNRRRTRRTWRKRVAARSGTQPQREADRGKRSEDQADAQARPIPNMDRKFVRHPSDNREQDLRGISWKHVTI